MHDLIADRQQSVDPRFMMKNKGNKGKGKGVKKKKKDTGILSYVFNLFACIFISFSMLAMNFILFASSGPGNVFAGATSLKPEIMYALIAILAVVALICFVFSFLNILMYLFTGLVVFLVSFAMFNQFANFSSNNLTGTSSETLISLVLGAAIFAVLLLTPKKIKAFVILTAVFCFGAVLVNQNQSKPEFVVKETFSDGSNMEGNQKFIYIMAPNAASYSYISSIPNTDAGEVFRKQLMSIMLGFYAKNGFKIYPNAYVTENNPFLNAAKILNDPAENVNEVLQVQVLKESYWQFKNSEDFEVYLRENKLFDTFKEKKHLISAYQSRGINLCKKGDTKNVFRCTTKINTPVNVASLRMPVEDKAQILVVQWLESTGWFNHGMDAVHGYIKPFFNPNNLPIVGMTYKNLYVINAMKTIDHLADDIARDRGNNAYFVYLDLPADTFVYDDMCQLRPMNTWLNKVNLPWVDSRNPIEKRNAYLRQTMCLYGKLEQFMRELKEKGILDNATIVFHGLSGADDLLGVPNVSLGDGFRNGQMVALAIREPASKQIVINQSVCSVGGILRGFFDGSGKCEEFEGVTLSKTTKQSVKEAVGAVKFTNDIAQRALKEFAIWHRDWAKLNFRSAPPSAALPSVESQVVPLSKSPELEPMEEVFIGKNKVMSGQVQVQAEPKTKPLSEVPGEAQ